MFENSNPGVPSTLREDLELFRRVMRVINVLEDRDMNRLTQAFSPSSDIGLQPAFNSDPRGCRPDAETGDNAIEDEDDEEDDDDEDDEDDEDANSDDDNDNDDDDEENEDELDWDEDNEDDDDNESDDTSYYYEQPQRSKDHTDVLSSEQQPTPLTTRAPSPAKDDSQEIEHDASNDADLCCWEHGCNGRKFTTRSNLGRHQREKSWARPACHCPRCGAIFSRTTARNTHVARGSCNRIRRYSNGRTRPNLSASPRKA